MSVSDKNFYHGLISDLKPDPPTDNGPKETVHQPRLHPKQAPGKYWINVHACVFCDASSAEAPNNIRMDHDSEARYTAYVYRQPESPEEEAAMQNAIRVCPTDAIMDTGTENA